MKYFETYYPYYALVKDENKEDAMKTYVKFVADDDGTLHLEMKEVERDYALAKYSRGLSEDGKEIPISEILDDFQSEESSVLLIDPALV
ncbi:hypothetical protein NST12_16675 [Bacillus sp. FSL W8-1127]|uniref:hypothetical protein n=1 Tax=Bacillus TaxID=1386 RepID=UPI0030F7E45D